MALKNFIKRTSLKHPELAFKLKKAGSYKSPYEFIYQTIYMTVLTYLFFFIIVYLVASHNLYYFLIGFLITLLFIPLFYYFWFKILDVWITKEARDQEGDLLFISEYFLVMLESGLPLGNAIERLSKLDRPGGKFFRRVFAEVRSGKDLETALDDASRYAASESLKTLLKRLRDSLQIGVDLRDVLKNFIEEASQKKLVEIRKYSRKLNPIVMMYLLLGIVVPSLGMTFFILAATLLDISGDALRVILIFLFLIMFGFQYFAYSVFKFTRTSI